MTHPAGDVDYRGHGARYAQRRRTDPRIATAIHAALGPARTVLNVGAGTGSYEPLDRIVTAVEPSAAMRTHRTTPALAASAEALPFADGTFDAAMATMTVHQWRDLDAGLRELRRVSRGRVVVLTGDPDHIEDLWVADYLPTLLAGERSRFPSIARVVAGLGEPCSVSAVPVPLDCVDGFIEAFYGRPESLLDPWVRAAQSAWTFVPDDDVERGLARLRADLGTGDWDRRYGELRTRPTLDGSLRLVVAG